MVVLRKSPLHECFEVPFTAFLINETVCGLVASPQTPVPLHKVLEEEIKTASESTLKNVQALLS